MWKIVSYFGAQQEGCALEISETVNEAQQQE